MENAMDTQTFDFDFFYAKLAEWCVWINGLLYASQKIYAASLSKPEKARYSEHRYLDDSGQVWEYDPISNHWCRLQRSASDPFSAYNKVPETKFIHKTARLNGAGWFDSVEKPSGEALTLVKHSGGNGIYQDLGWEIPHAVDELFPHLTTKNATERMVGYCLKCLEWAEGLKKNRKKIEKWMARYAEDNKEKLGNFNPDYEAFKNMTKDLGMKIPPLSVDVPRGAFQAVIDQLALGRQIRQYCFEFDK